MPASKGRKTILKPPSSTKAVKLPPADTDGDEEKLSPEDKPSEDQRTDTEREADEQAAQVRAELNALSEAKKEEPDDGRVASKQGFSSTVVIGGAQKEMVTDYPDGEPRLPWEQPVYVGMPRDGVVLGPGDPTYVRGIMRDRVVVELTENVYRAILPPTSLTPVFSLVHNKGAKIDSRLVTLITDRDQ